MGPLSVRDGCRTLITLILCAAAVDQILINLESNFHRTALHWAALNFEWSAHASTLYTTSACVFLLFDAAHAGGGGPPPTILLEAHFEDQVLGPVGTGGAALGQPSNVAIYVQGTIVEAVAPTPMHGGKGVAVNHALEIARSGAGTNTGSLRFDMLGNAEIDEGIFALGFQFWAPTLSDRRIRFRESVSSAQDFGELQLTNTGAVRFCTESTSCTEIGPYSGNRAYYFVFYYDMDADTVSITMDGLEVVSDVPHRFPGQGIGAVLFTLINNAQPFYVDSIDAIWISSGLFGDG